MPRFLPLAVPALFAALVLPGHARADGLDRADDAFRAAAYRQAWAGALGRDHAWSNPVTGHAGTVRAVRERLDPASRQPCREILETLSTAGNTTSAYAVGCRTADGTWSIVQASASDEGSAVSAASGVAPADVTPYQAPADISADGPAPASSPTPEVRILVPWRGVGALPTPH